MGFRAPRGEDSSEPVPLAARKGASGAVRSGVRIPYAFFSRIQPFHASNVMETGQWSEPVMLGWISADWTRGRRDSDTQK